MNEKYSLKVILNGKTQQVRTLQNGAGITGQAVVIQASDAARYQLVNVVTLTSPANSQLKRVGESLHLVLPSGTHCTAITSGVLQVSELATLGIATANLTNNSYLGGVLVNRLNNVYDNIIAVDHGSSVSRATIKSLPQMQASINNTSVTVT